MGKTVTAFAPGSIGNFSVGFDLLGAAIEGIGDTVSISTISEDKVIIESIDGDESIPLDSSKNTATIPLLSMKKKLNYKEGLVVNIKKGIPLSSGLGGSAASAVAAVLGANEIFDNPFSVEELYEFALEGEAYASGGVHGDNVAPSLYGGIALCMKNNKVIPLPGPPELGILVMHPDIKIKTEDARAVLSENVKLKDYVIQTQYLGATMAGLFMGDAEMVIDNLKDHIIGPQRKHLISGFDEINKSITDFGGGTFGISGAGPTMFSLMPTVHDARSLENKVKETSWYRELKITSWPTVLDMDGAKIISVED